MTEDQDLEQDQDKAFLQRFSADVHKLFTEGKADMVEYFFSRPRSTDDPVRGLHYWKRFTSENKDYYLFHEEVQLIGENISALANILADRETIIDLGPGSEEAVRGKTIPVLAASASLERYCAVDLSESHGHGASELIAKTFPGIVVEPPYITDFFDDKTRMSG